MGIIRIVSYLFGLLASITVILLGVSFTKKQRAKYRWLKILDGKQLLLVVATIAFTALAYISNVYFEIINSPSVVDYFQTQSGNTIVIPSLKGFQEELTEMSSNETKRAEEYYRAAQLESQRENYSTAAGLLRSSIDLVPTAHSYYFLGLSLNNIGDNLNAEIAYVSGLKISREQDKEELEANILVALSETQAFLGKYETALENANVTLRLTDKLADKILKAKALTVFGSILLYQGELSSPIQYFQESLELFVEQKRYFGQAIVWTRFAYLYQRRKEYDQSIISSQKALELYRQVNNKYGIATAMFNIGAAKLEQGNVEESIEMFEVACAMYQEIANILGAASCLVNYGEVKFKQKQYSDARQKFAESVDGFEKSGYQKGVAFAYLGISRAYHCEILNDEALVFLEKAQAISTELGTDVELGSQISEVSDAINKNDINNC